MPHALQAARRGRQARRVVGGRVPAGAAGDVAVGAVPEADDDALPQPAGDGDRGAAALLPDRRRGADGRLRQDHARRCSWAPSSMDLPSIFVPAGPMLRGHWGGTTLGSGSDTWKYWADLRAGAITEEDWQEIENGIARSPGHCMTMGTASTMTSAAEALGVTLPGCRVDPGRRLPARRDGRAQRAADRRDGVGGRQALRRADPRRRSATRSSRVLALGGSTNAIIHLIAMARRVGVELSLADFEELARSHAAAGQHPPVGQVPDGGLLLRGRPAARC